MHIRRVGTITCGLALVIYGILFFLSSFIHTLDYTRILDFWPFILIGLGVEMLLAHRSSLQKQNCVLKYDVGSIVILILLMFFACGMGIADFIMHYMETHPL